MSSERDRALYERIYLVAQQVPRGMVATYGDIAAIVGNGCDARMVGYALNELPKGRDDQVPWQRIINAAGGISTRGSLQRQLLEAEGLTFDLRERVDLRRHRWSGPDQEWAAAHGFTTLAPAPAPQKEDEGQLRLF
ncbi:MAG TPA: MGMT family protein [Chloroflexota bacterium]|jgi:methylated-DNA-protein-cysteine methyltransferase-like protein|nr:MGMT family protein [Chloroflexota bacterium]